MNLSSQDSSVPADESAAMSSEQERRLWAEEYLATPDNDLGPHSDLIRQVKSDYIDHESLETKIQRLVPTITINGAFCGKCSRLLDHWPDLPVSDWQFVRGRSFGSIYEIEAAARAGCKFCVYLFSLLVKRRLLDPFRKIESRLFALGHGGEICLSIGIHNSQSMNLGLGLPGKPWSRVVLFYSLMTDPTVNLWHEETEVFELARIWLRQCSTSHEECRNLDEKEYSLPARLLSFDEHVVRVMHTESFSVAPQYATLSYCWGREPFTMLTLDSMDTLRQGITISDLPRVFRDAIHVARELGLSYIWIDALCIIQQGDGGQDWLRESGLMRSVYGDSYVNLAATSATDVRGTFFSKPEHYSGGFYARVTTNKSCTVRTFHGPDIL